MLFEPDEKAPKRVKKGTPAAPSEMGAVLAQIRAATKHIADDYRTFYQACYSNTTKPVESEQGRIRGKHLRSDPVGEVAGHREALRDELHTAHQQALEALSRIKSARGLVNHVGKGLGDR